MAVCAVSARFSTHPSLDGERPFLRGKDWAAAARDIARKHYDEPDITLITAMLLLGLHEFGTCEGGRSWASAGVSFRMAYALRLHQDLETDPSRAKLKKLSVTEKEIRRRVMWSCYLMDRFNSSGTEMPTFINEEHLNIKLPIREHLFQLELGGPTEQLDGFMGPSPPSRDQVISSDPVDNMGVAAHMIRVVALWGRVVQYLNLGGKEKDRHRIWSPQSRFADLQRQAEEWSRSLPSRLQYTPSNLQIHASEKMANQFLFMHIVIHQVRLYMSRFGIPSASNGFFLKDAPAPFREHLLHTALESASQISSIIKDSTAYRLVAPFVGYCAYVSSTVRMTRPLGQRRTSRR